MRILRFFAVLVLLGLAGAAWLFFTLDRPYQGFQGEKFIDFPKGTSAAQMADMLQNEGVIRSRWQFMLARALNRRRLQAGEYRFNQPQSVMDVYDRIARGDVFYYELVVPEGKNIFDIGALAEKTGLFTARQFVAAARDPAMIRDLDPAAPSLEGYLFPNTYRLSRHTTPERLCHIMTSKFREVWRGLNTTANVHDTVTLASLVEKEGKLASERPVIAGVFENRLRIGMKLDCDPTTIYAALLENRYNGGLHKADLESANPYNTYRHAGLPPGPVANPGLASIKAVLHPAETTALYFVLRPDGSGAHRFSDTFAAQQTAVAEYVRGLHNK